MLDLEIKKNIGVNIKIHILHAVIKISSNLRPSKCVKFVKIVNFSLKIFLKKVQKSLKFDLEFNIFLITAYIMCITHIELPMAFFKINLS